jgi:hypothetical protein
MPIIHSDEDCPLCKYRIGTAGPDDLWLLFDEDEGVRHMDIHLMCLLSVLVQLEEPEGCTELKVQVAKQDGQV